jgi:hypothetical protein
MQLCIAEYKPQRTLTMTALSIVEGDSIENSVVFSYLQMRNLSKSFLKNADMRR